MPRKILCLFILLFTSNCYAYLDPGSSSVLLSTVAALITVGFFLIKKFFYEKIAFWGNKESPLDTNTNYNIVVYSEGSQYWNVFLPIIRELDKKGAQLLYLSSSEDDPGLKFESENISTQFIGKDYSAYYILNRLKANLVLMTTPGLGVLQIKRSKDVNHYCFITHSAGNCARYKAHGIDYYDSILVGGYSDKDNILELESKRGTQKKQIEIIGCTYLDVLREKLNNENFDSIFNNNREKTILLSPTWGDHGLLNKYGESVLKILSNQQVFNLIIRPHPQSFISEKGSIESLMDKFPNSDSLIWDDNPEGLRSMYLSDIMVSDFSGIVFDYLFLFQRPVISFKAQFEKRGRDAMDLNEELLEMQFLDKIGEIVDEDDIKNLDSIIKNTLSNNSDFEKHLEEAQKAFTQFPGESGIKAAEVIIDIINNQKQNS